MRVPFACFCLGLGLSILCGGPLQAGPVLDKVKAEGVIRCGSTARPGLVAEEGDGHWGGLNVAVCRAVATAVLGSPDKIAFSLYETPKQFDAVRRADDDLFFLSATEITREGLTEKVLPGPTVFLESHAVMVPETSPVRHLKNLAGAKICFLTGSMVERSLKNALDTLDKPWFAMPFTEDGEMVDAYDVQRCQAIAYEVTTLASLPAPERHSTPIRSRILPESLSVFPIFAATPVSDGQWAAIVAWTVHTLVSAERPDSRWYAGGANAMPLTAPALGLDRGWQKRVLAAVGSMGDIYDRNIGRKSSLKLARGLNDNQVRGGLMLSPFLE